MSKYAMTLMAINTYTQKTFLWLIENRWDREKVHYDFDFVLLALEAMAED